MIVAPVCQHASWQAEIYGYSAIHRIRLTFQDWPVCFLTLDLPLQKTSQCSLMGPTRKMAQYVQRGARRWYWYHGQYDWLRLQKMTTNGGGMQKVKQGQDRWEISQWLREMESCVKVNGDTGMNRLKYQGGYIWSTLEITRRRRRRISQGAGWWGETKSSLLY